MARPVRQQFGQAWRYGPCSGDRWSLGLRPSVCQGCGGDGDRHQFERREARTPTRSGCRSSDQLSRGRGVGRKGSRTHRRTWRGLRCRSRRGRNARAIDGCGLRRWPCCAHRRPRRLCRTGPDRPSHGEEPARTGPDRGKPPPSARYDRRDRGQRNPSEISDSFPLERLAAAFRHQESGAHFGKIAVEI